jgi:hypothetical protein
MVVSSLRVCRIWLGGLALVLVSLAQAGDEPPPTNPLDRAAEKPLALTGFALGPFNAQRPECLACLLAAAQAADADPQAPPAPPLDDAIRPQVAAAQIVGAREGVAAAAMFQRGLQVGLWVGKPVRGPLIDRDLLVGVEDRQPLLGFDKSKYEMPSYCNLIAHAREVSSEALAKVTQRDVFYPNLLGDPDKHRGQPVHIKGRMARLLKIDAPRGLWKEGIRNLYEGYIYPDETSAANPYCVVFTELPKEASLGEKVKYYVSCDAYFFKILRYEAPDAKDPNRKVGRNTPMLVGRTFKVIPASEVMPADDGKESPFAGKWLIPSVLSLIGGLIGLFFALHYWFRRGDKKVHARIWNARYSEFVEPTGNDQDVNTSSPPTDTSRETKPSGN